MKIILAGPGAFGKKHLDGLKNIEGVEVVVLVGQPLELTQAVAVVFLHPSFQGEGYQDACGASAIRTTATQLQML